MAKDKEIDCATVNEEGFAQDLAVTFVDCYKSMFDIELKVDEIEKLARDVLPEEFKICDIPIYLQKMQELITEVVSIPTEMISALNGAISGVTQDIQNKLQELANKVAEEIKEVTDKAQDKLDEIKDAVSDKIDEVTDKIEDKIEDLKENVNEKADAVKDDISALMDKLKIPAEAVQYPAMGIILKRFQIIQYRCQIIQKNLMLLMAQARKKVLCSLLIGKDDAGSPATTQFKLFLMGVAAGAMVIAVIIDVILTLINSIVILNVDAGGCAFGPTPKSLMMTSKMVVANTKQSTTCSIPEPVDLAITEAEKQYETVKGETKKAQVLAMSSAGAASVASGGLFNPGNFPPLPKLDGDTIRQAIKLILMLLVDAEALPRYEKLTPINIRFLVFLITGFEPAAKKTFGMPGFP
jgi:ElaB/YqjD/DUF883 family membrane-anchored ribosome-binding protein